MEYKILPILKNDLFEINKVLIKEVGENSMNNLKKHLRQGVAKKLVNKGGQIMAFCLALEYTTHFSLSYYYIYEEQRKKMQSLFFFLHCMGKMRNKPIYVKKNRNYEMYSRYFTQSENKDNLLFTGLRKDMEWVELFHQSEK